MRKSSAVLSLCVFAMFAQTAWAAAPGLFDSLKSLEGQYLARNCLHKRTIPYQNFMTFKDGETVTVTVEEPFKSTSVEIKLRTPERIGFEFSIMDFKETIEIRDQKMKHVCLSADTQKSWDGATLTTTSQTRYFDKYFCYFKKEKMNEETTAQLSRGNDDTLTLTYDLKTVGGISIDSTCTLEKISQ